ncbi:hypothetical protein GBAR_LOCUS23374 [Geodia barretti]|uniref:Uncharacterized protein n=1 Tax=Geodia barretti TaxID=519541 RepID=A0AA35X1Q8_GEOBA|nr:hypothetical protein GBAR_LOCUS23374 [Geodia barretti]
MHCTPINAMPSTTSKPTARIDWSKATQSSIMMYQDMVSDRLSAPPIMFLQCSQPECTALLDDYVNHIVSTLLDCAFCCFPSKSSSSRRVHGWNDSAAKEASILWHRIWTEAGCPSAGVLSTIKKHAKKRYKYEEGNL